MNSPISNFVEVLRLVRDSAHTYEEHLRNNEAATRAVLIDPVLRALGWDVANPARVQIEKCQTTGNTQSRVDYGLMEGSTLRIVVEAKKLSGNLQQDFLQVVQYAFAFGVESLFLTDGVRWLHYTSLTPNNTEPTTEINLSKDELEKVASYFVQQLDAALIAPETPQIDELAQKVEQLDAIVQKLQSHIIKIQTVDEVKQFDIETTNASPALQIAKSKYGWHQLTAIADAKRTKPSQLKLPNGFIIPVSSWSQVLTECCRFALQQNTQLLQEAINHGLRDRAAGEVFLVGTQRPPSNRNSNKVEIDNNVLHVDVNYPANESIANAIHLLRKIPGASQSMPEIIFLQK